MPTKDNNPPKQSLDATSPEVVQVLLSPEAYPHRPKEVTLQRTHISLLFFAGDYVYKIKKPVNLGFLDFSTLEKRRFYCHREVLLNRRLSPGVYLGVVEVTQDRDRIRVEGKGRLVDYAVKMHRLPHEQMLEERLKRNSVVPQMLAAIAQRLADFHEQSETSSEISSYGKPEAVLQNIEENFTQMRPYVGRSLPEDRYRLLESRTLDFIRRNRGLFERRVEGGQIRDCHGDVRAEHICVNDEVNIIDCIEFNERFRYGDVASEAAFLAMDLDYLGRPDLAALFVSSYPGSQGEDFARLLPFYKAYRAYVRGKVESFKLDEPGFSPEEKEDYLRAARNYFALAYHYLAQRSKPILLITCGLVGTGKTSLAKALAERMNLAMISSDVVRKTLASVPLTEHKYEAVGQGIYSEAFSQQTYQTLFAAARQILQEGRSVVIDASFSKVAQRRVAMALAEELGVGFWLLECVCPDEKVRERLEERRDTVSDGRWEIYAPQKAGFEPCTEIPPAQRLIINTSISLEASLKQALARLPLAESASSDQP